MSVNSVFSCPTLREALTYCPGGRLEIDRGRGDRHGATSEEEPVARLMQQQLSGATLTLPSHPAQHSGDSQRIFLTSTASLHFPHYWKLDTVICYWVSGLQSLSLYGKLNAALSVMSGITVLCDGPLSHTWSQCIACMPSPFKCWRFHVLWSYGIKSTLITKNEVLEYKTDKFYKVVTIVLSVWCKIYVCTRLFTLSESERGFGVI